MRKHLPALVVFLWLTALTLSGFVAVLNSYRERIQDEFEDAASAHAQSIQRSLEVKLLILESMLSLYAIFDGMPQPEFGSFVKPFEAKLEGVQALQWIVPVTAERARGLRECAPGGRDSRLPDHRTQRGRQHGPRR